MPAPFQSGFEVRMSRRLFLFNTTIITGLPAQGEATYSVQSLSVESARAIHAAAPEVVSAIGHDAAAAALAALLDAPVAVSRIPAAQAAGDQAICLKIRGRLPEGKILSLPEMGAIGFDLYLLTRTS